MGAGCPNQQFVDSPHTCVSSTCSTYLTGASTYPYRILRNWFIFHRRLRNIQNELIIQFTKCFQATSNVRTHSPQYYSNSLPTLQESQIAQERKFAEKPNALKKVALDDLDEIQTNSISDGGFSWSNMLGIVLKLLSSEYVISFRHCFFFYLYISKRA